MDYSKILHSLYAIKQYIMIMKLISAERVTFSVPNISLEGKKFLCIPLQMHLIYKGELCNTHRALRPNGKLLRNKFSLGHNIKN